jgi:signal recognition particle subunit SRP54
MGMPGMEGMGNPYSGRPQPGWRGYPGSGASAKKKKKDKKKKGFGSL